MALVPNAGYDAVTNSNNVNEINPLPNHEVTEPSLANEILEANATLYFPFNMETYRRHAIQINYDVDESDSMNFTIEATVMDNDIPDNLDFADVTQDVIGAASFSPTGTGKKLLLDGLGVLSACKYVRLVCTFVGTAGSSFQAYVRKVY